MRIFSFYLLIAFLVLTSCQSEKRIYKRVGGDHLHLKAKNKELFWFSGMHGSNPKNPMFADIKREFESFSPHLVFVEGHANKSIYENELDAIRNGESAYVSFLARNNGITCLDIEPNDSIINHYLFRKYGKEEVLSMYLIRQMIQWGRNKNKDFNFEEQVISYINWENSNIGHFNKEITLDMVSKLLNPYSGIQSINNQNWRNFDAKTYLYFSDNKISEVYNAISEYRNIYLVDVIKESISKYDKIFVMMGFDHAKEMNAELRLLFKN